ncbi:vpu protein [Simian immunodeficiency virus]|uniref:Vpu protein n=1 Tax=Simian immunodeficiency virus TaxID=11723 RepID=G1EH04_SIV|nr:vpu protein [Simian immunodeficiency virus]
MRLVGGSIIQNVVGILFIIVVIVGGGALIGWGIRREIHRERLHQRVLERLTRRLSIDSGIEEDEEINWNNFDPQHYNPRDWI